MAFIETQFPTDISSGASGGAGFQTDVIVVNSGFEQRNANWADARCAFDVSHGVKTQEQLNALISFFRVMKGKANSFRFKDWTDFIVTTSEGIFATIDATHFQMYKLYTTSGNAHERKITKPVSGTVTVTGGTAISINYTTGIVTVSSGTPTAWAGEFDVPCRFDTDQMKATIDQYSIYSWGNIPVVEVRV